MGCEKPGKAVDVPIWYIAAHGTLSSYHRSLQCCRLCVEHCLLSFVIQIGMDEEEKVERLIVVVIILWNGSEQNGTVPLHTLFCGTEP